jgi:hypothetical protein
MKLKTMFAPAAALSIALFSAPASAVLLDFIGLTEDNPGGLGESAWTTLSPTGAFGLNIKGYVAGDNQAYAYLDWSNAGLGVCGDASQFDVSRTGMSSNVCNPSSDDNVTTDEHLEFVFDKNVIIEDIWVNNNHDTPFGFAAGDLITVNGVNYGAITGYAGDANGILTSSILLNAGDVLKIANNNQQFYVSGVSVSAVPVPAAIWLFGSALLGFIGYGRRTNVS